MKRLSLIISAATLLPAPCALAQSMDSMPGMEMPARSKPAASSKATAEDGQPLVKAESAKPAEPTPSMQDKPDLPGMAMRPSGPQPAHDANSMPGTDTNPAQTGGPLRGTDLPSGNTTPPPPPSDHAADRTFSPVVMARARDQFRIEQGGQNFHQILFNLAEFQVRDGRDAYRWVGEGWFGGDINRLVIKSEGEGTVHEGADSAEVQALYSRAIGPYFDLQAGVRHDFQPLPSRTYATVGIEGLAPYMFQTEAALFLSNKGDVLGRLEGWYDQRVTQRLVLQPRVELNLSTQDVPENRVGSGLVNAELGLRLRYEFSRQFAPYVGVTYEAKTGRTADFARARGEDPSTTSFVVGLRVWF